MADKRFLERPRPRVLVLGFDDDVFAALHEAFPTVDKMGSIKEVDQSDYDLLVTDQGVMSIDTHVWVVAVGHHYFGSFAADTTITRGGLPPAVVFGDGSLARELVRSGDLSPSVESLVDEDLLPLLANRARKDCLAFGWDDGMPCSPSGLELADVVIPLIQTSTGEFLAGCFRRRGGESECFCLPKGADPLKWSLMATELWHESAPERFPSPTVAWKRNKRWAVAAERTALTEVDRVERERVGELERLDSAVSEAVRRLKNEQRLADEGLRRLLTEQDDALVEVVSIALSTLGFDVESKDPSWDPMDKLEDLHVREPGTNWFSLCEVRGYKKGAPLADLTRIFARFVPRFREREGRRASAALYVVNHSLSRDPGSRDIPLKSHPEDVRIYADGDVPLVVIDTVALFELARDVGLGVLSRDAARARVRQARGWLEYP